MHITLKRIRFSISPNFLSIYAGTLPTAWDLDAVRSRHGQRPRRRLPGAVLRGRPDPIDTCISISFSTQQCAVPLIELQFPLRALGPEGVTPAWIPVDPK